MHLSRKWSYQVQLRTILWLPLVLLLFFVGQSSTVQAQQMSESTVFSTYDLYNPARTPGTVLSKGNNEVPFGKLKVKSYQLEEIELAKPLELVIQGRKEQFRSVLRLRIGGEEFLPGSYRIWVGDTALGDVSYSRTELVTIIFDRSSLEDGESLAVSSETQGDPQARTVLPDRLYLPAQARGSMQSASGNVITRMRKVNLPGGSYVIEIELTTDTEIPTLNAIPVVQIGKREFLNVSTPDSDRNKAIVRLTPEEFSQLRDGEKVIFKFGRGTQGGRKFGKLNKGLLEKALQ